MFYLAIIIFSLTVKVIPKNITNIIWIFLEVDLTKSGFFDYKYLANNFSNFRMEILSQGKAYEHKVQHKERK